jgi:hypothetical protein
VRCLTARLRRPGGWISPLVSGLLSDRASAADADEEEEASDARYIPHVLDPPSTTEIVRHCMTAGMRNSPNASHGIGNLASSLLWAWPVSSLRKYGATEILTALDGRQQWLMFIGVAPHLRRLPRLRLP